MKDATISLYINFTRIQFGNKSILIIHSDSNCQKPTKHVGCISEASYTTLDYYQLHEMYHVAPFNTAMISLHPVFFYKPAIRNFILVV